jgi:hypothetical protein
MNECMYVEGMVNAFNVFRKEVLIVYAEYAPSKKRLVTLFWTPFVSL